MKWNFLFIMQFNKYFVWYTVDSIWFMWCFQGAQPSPVENVFTDTESLLNFLERYQVANYLPRLESGSGSEPFIQLILIYMTLVQGYVAVYCFNLMGKCCSSTSGVTRLVVQYCRLQCIRDTDYLWKCFKLCQMFCHVEI